MPSTQPIQRHTLELQPRDLLLLRGLFESRVMTLAHACRLYFEGKSEAAKKRLQKLKAAGLVRERPRRPYEPAVLFLTSRAFMVLHERGHLAGYPHVGLSALEKRAQVSEMTLRHELEVMDVKAALTAAVSALPRFRLIEFSTWPLLTQFRSFQSHTGGYGREEVLLKPDGLIRIHEKEGDDVFEHAFFLEVDRSTESQEVLARKAACYVEHYRSGGFAERCGGRPEEFQQFPFRVLMIFRNDERRNNAAQRLLRSIPPIQTQVWLTTSANIRREPLGAIWVRPVEYYNSTASTTFNKHCHSDSSINRHWLDGEPSIGQSLNERTLFNVNDKDVDRNLERRDGNLCSLKPLNSDGQYNLKNS